MMKKHRFFGVAYPCFTAAFTLMTLSSTVLPSPTQAAEVRVAHLSPDAPAVDVLVGTDDTTKSAVLTNVSFPAVSDYLTVDDGNYYIDVAATGTTAPVIDVNDVTLAGELTIAAVNNLASIEPLVLVDDRVVTPGKAKLRAVHASPNAPAVDIFVDGAGLLPALTNLSFKDSTDYLELDPGAYTFRFRATGTTDDVFVVDGLELAGSMNYSAFAIGELGSSFSVLPTVDAVPEPSSLSLFGLGVFVLGSIRGRRRA